MEHDVRDFWSFVDKIQSATDYVQELLTENSRLRRRLADLEKEKELLAQELDQLSRLLDRGRRQDPVVGGDADVSGLHNAVSRPPARSLRLAH